MEPWPSQFLKSKVPILTPQFLSQSAPKYDDKILNVANGLSRYNGLRVRESDNSSLIRRVTSH